MNVGQLIRGLKKYPKSLDVIQGGVEIKAMRIWVIPDEMSADGLRVYSTKLVVRLIRKDEKRA
jgi:hypothetical protein